MSFRAPVRDLAFTLTEVAGLREFAPDLDDETIAAVLQGGAQLAEEVLAPLNRSGDQHGARYENGRVTAAPGFAEAYRAFAQGGWNSLAADPEYGGQGLPKALELAVFEMVHAANMAFGLCPMLTQAAIEALHVHGSGRQKALYLPRLISGEWTGTMNLTEPQAGTDLAAVRARAEPLPDGGYALHGQKIFITWGDHDVAENIVHFVLARLPDAPEGVKGISLFLTSKREVAEDGALGGLNAVRPAGIEHKLGINASPTCVMVFEGARAELVGQPHQGLAHMFTMMNAARLGVGVEGVAIAERAYQQALGYALERRQGRSAWSGQPGAPIFDHPDVRRMLSLMKAKIEAARAICLLAAVAADRAGQGDERARRRYELLVPVAKAWSTDVGVEVASLGVQVHGGMGFIEETGAAQHYRDARIAPIYEGTNGVQALDLIGRKLGMENGLAVTELAEDMRATAEGLSNGLSDLTPGLRDGIDAVERGAEWLLRRRGTPDALAGAVPFLNLVGDVVGGWLLAKAALAAQGRPGDAYLGAKPWLARFYGDHVLAAAPSRLAAVTAGAEELYALTPELLGAA
jgi:alkylation response protein AidB-like acyl-CoA dehydrogenase